MIIDRLNIGKWIRPYDLDGERITRAASADTEAMTARVRQKRRLDTDPEVFEEVTLSRLACDPNAPPDVIDMAEKIGIGVDRQ